MSRTLPITLCLLLGCAFDAHRQGERCQTDETCLTGEICRDGLCQAGLPDLTPAEAGAADAGTLNDAAPPDLSWPVDQGPRADRALPADAGPPVDFARPVDQAPPPDMAPALPLPDSDPDFPAPCPPDARCFGATQDGHISAIAPTARADREPDLQVSQAAFGESPVKTLMRFDLNRWAGRRWPTACDLVLRRRRDPPGAPSTRLDLRRVEAAFGPNGWPAFITWDRQPAQLNRELILRFDAAPAGESQRVDVTEILDAVRADDAFAAGMLLQFDPSADNGGRVAFDSMDAASPPGVPPYLECRYAP